jgi:hypothetical protein
MGKQWENQQNPVFSLKSTAELASIMQTEQRTTKNTQTTKTRNEIRDIFTILAKIKGNGARDIAWW